MAATRSVLRTSFRACYAEGAVAELFGACAGGAVLTAWALHLGATTFTIGLLGALPLAAQVLQLPGAWLTHTFGPKAVAVTAIGASRMLWLPMVALPFVDLSAATALHIFIAVVALAAVFGVIGNNAWTAWMGELVPGPIRGRFFSRRTVYISIASTIASLGAAVALDGLSPRGLKGATLGALAGVACLAGALSLYLLYCQHAPARARARERIDWRVLRAVVAAPHARAFVRYLLGWNAAVALSASFFSLHMLTNLQTGFGLAALHGVAVAAVRIVSAPLWGRAVDHLGARPVLIFCSFSIAAVPAVWLFATPAFLWPLAIEAVLAGALWGGHGIAVMDLTVNLSRHSERPFYLAVFATAGGLGFAVSAVLAGLLASHLPARFEVLGEPWTNLHVLFLLSAVARVLAALPALWIVEPGACDVRTFLRLALGGATATPRRLTS
ncbi:MAG TPA: MFS transporter [Methylomirabilota bacterium]|nr:MFS transporter [Methylomirabilota bacterium]